MSAFRGQSGITPPTVRRDGLRWYVESVDDEGDTRYFGYRRTPWTARRLARTALGVLALEWFDYRADAAFEEAVLADDQ